jgi:hypothetical protein
MPFICGLVLIHDNNFCYCRTAFKTWIFATFLKSLLVRYSVFSIHIGYGNRKSK